MVVAVSVPIHGGGTSRVVNKVEARNGRNRGEASPARVQERTIALITAQRTAVSDQFIETIEMQTKCGIGSLHLLDVRFILRRLRQNLPPINGSQVVRFGTRHKTIAHKEIFPAVVIEVNEQ